MIREDTYQVERTKWDEVALQKLPAASVVSPFAGFHDYARQHSTMSAAGIADFIGDLHGKHVLEYGCGVGEHAVLLAKSGAHVSAFDLSPVSIAVARRRAELNQMEANIDLTVAAGKSLPYADESFDIIFGLAILHHLDVTASWADLYRVLKAGGKAVFVEPMGMNPLLNFVRAWIPYPTKRPRGADRPLNYEEIHAWGQPFNQFHYQEILLLSMVERAFGFKTRLPILRRLDNILLKHLPFLRRYCRYVALFMIK